MDGVLCDFFGGALDICNKLTGENYTKEEYVDQYGKWGINDFYNIPIDEMWKAIENDKTFWHCLDPISYAQELYSLLSDYGNITIVTSPSMCRESATHKLAWLALYFSISPKDVFIGSKKHLMAGNGILIDDWKENCDSFNKNGGFSILVPSEWNTKNLTLDMVWEPISKSLNLYEHGY